MSWFQVLKDEEKPKKIEPKKVKPQVMGYNEERKKFHRRRDEKIRRERESAKTKDANIFDFGKQEEEKEPVDYSTSRNFATGRLREVWQASFEDDSWNKFLEENSQDGKLKPDVKRSVLAARKLLAGETVNLSGTKYNLKNPFGAKKDAMLERLNTVTLRGTKTSNIRESMLSDVDKFIEDGEYQKLLEMLQGEKSRSRVRRYIATKEELSRKITTDSEEEHPELVEIRKLLKIMGMHSKADIQGSIDEDTVVTYIKLVADSSRGATPSKKAEAISMQHRNSLNAKSMFSGKKLLPALDYILQNSHLDTSRIPTSYKKRSAKEQNAITRLMSGKGLRQYPALKVLYEKNDGMEYQQPIEAYYGPDNKEDRILAYSSGDLGTKWDTMKRKADKAIRELFIQIKENPSAEDELQSLLGGDTDVSMTPKIRDDIVAALTHEDDEDIPKLFNSAIDDLGIRDNFTTIREIESKIGDIGDEEEEGEVVIALRRMNEVEGKLIPKAADREILSFFHEEKMDMWSILDSALDDDLDTFNTQGKAGGTLNNIIIVLRTLSRMFSTAENQIDPEDILDGEITADEFKEQLSDKYNTIRQDFFDAVEANMKRISSEGRRLGFTLPLQAGSKYGVKKKIEPITWIQYATGVLE
tara:strand:- start:3354 stop:5279 length:1926 start_codon:yes stop_codon:yes gene_type:complete